MKKDIILYELEKNGNRIPISERELIRRSEKTGVRKGDLIFSFSYIYVNGKRMTAQNVPVLQPIFERFKQEDYEELEGVDDLEEGRSAKLLALIKEKNPEIVNSNDSPENLLRKTLEKSKTEMPVRSIDHLLAQNGNNVEKSQEAQKVFSENDKIEAEKAVIKNIENEFSDGISDELFSTTVTELVPKDTVPQKMSAVSGDEEVAVRTQKAAAAIESFKEYQKSKNKKLILSTTVYTLLAIFLISGVVLATQTRFFEDLFRKFRKKEEYVGSNPVLKVDNDLLSKNVPSKSPAIFSAQNDAKNEDPPKNDSPNNKVTDNAALEHKIDNHDSEKSKTDDSQLSNNSNNKIEVKSTPQENSVQNKTLNSDKKPDQNKALNQNTMLGLSQTSGSSKISGSSKDSEKRQLLASNRKEISGQSEKAKNSRPEENKAADKNETVNAIAEPDAVSISEKKEDLSQYALSKVIAGWKGNLEILAKDRFAGKVAPEAGKLVWGSRVGKPLEGPDGTPKTAILLNGTSEKVTFSLDAFPNGDFIINLDFFVAEAISKGGKAKILSACCRNSDDPVSVVLEKDHKLYGMTEGFYKSGDLLYEYVHKTEPFIYSFDVWYHLIVVRKNGLMYFYINNKLISAPFKISSEKTKTRKIAIGGNPIADEYASCRIANFILAVPKPNKK